MATANGDVGTTPAPTLTFLAAFPPFAILAAAKLAGVAIDVKADPKFPKDAQPTLIFPSG